MRKMSPSSRDLYRAYLILNFHKFYYEYSDSEAEDNQFPIPDDIYHEAKEIPIVDLPSGFYFGELGLQGKPRKASVYAKKDTHMFYLEQSDFDKVKKRIEERLLC